MRELYNTLSNKTVFITGGTGFIGKSLIGDLLNKGAIIYCYGRSKSKIESIFGDAVNAATDFSTNEKSMRLAQPSLKCYKRFRPAQ